MDVLALDILLYPLKCTEVFSLISVGKAVSLVCQSVFPTDWKGKDEGLGSDL